MTIITIEDKKITTFLTNFNKKKLHNVNNTGNCLFYLSSTQ